MGSEEFREQQQRNSDGSQTADTKKDAEACNDFWSIEGDVTKRHHVEHRVQLCVSKEETFPISLKSIDVTSTTLTHLDVLQESRIDDHWNVHVDRRWTGFKKFTTLYEKAPTGYMWSEERLTKIQATTRPDHLSPEMWSGMSTAAQRRGKAAMGHRKNRSSTMRGN